MTGQQYLAAKAVFTTLCLEDRVFDSDCIEAITRDVFVELNLDPVDVLCGDEKKKFDDTIPGFDVVREIRSHVPSRFKKYISGIPRCDIVWTDREIVDWLLTLNTHNRRVSKPTVSAYSQDMANGNWPLVPNGIGISKDGILIDGQHRLLANAKAGYPPVQMLIVSGLDMGAQKMIDQHNKRNMSAVFNLAFNVALSSGKAGTIRLLSAYDRGNAQRAEDFAILPTVLRPSVAEASATFDKYGDRILKIRDGDRGFSAAFWSVIIYAIEHGADEQKTMDFVDRCKTGNNLTAKEPARRWRRIFIEGYSPVVNGKAEQFSQKMAVKWTAVLLFKHLGIDRLDIDSSNTETNNTETTTTKE